MSGSRRVTGAIASADHLTVVIEVDVVGAQAAATQPRSVSRLDITAAPYPR